MVAEMRGQSIAPFMFDMFAGTRGKWGEGYGAGGRGGGE